MDVYAQWTNIHVHEPLTKQIDDAIQSVYVPLLVHRPGFVALYVLHDAADPTVVELLQLWDTHSSALAFARTGAFARFIGQLRDNPAAIRCHCDGYVVHVALRVHPSMFALPALTH
jgi:hypothetical protein